MIDNILQTSKADIHYIQDGKGPDIVWIPAGDQACTVYHAQFDAFRDSHRCTCFDPRGAGTTVSHTDPPWDIAEYAHDCAELIREVCEPPVILIGLSLGALITKEVCLSYPELVRLGIPMGTIARKTGFAFEWEEAEIALATRGVTLPEDFSIIHYAILSYPAEVLGDDALWQKCRPYVASAYGHRDVAMLAAQWDACLKYDSLERLPDCRVPLHVISFEQDLQTPPSRGRVVAEAAAMGTFHLIEGAGHFSIFGHMPETINDRIRKIIDAA